MLLTQENNIYKAMKDDRIALGVNVQTNNPELVEMAGQAGYDYIMIDWEHGSFGTDSVVQMIRAAQVTGTTPIVRTPSADSVWIQRVLDAGAQGVVVPHVNTAHQAAQIAQACRYGTSGNGRGACPSVRAAGHLTRDWKSFSLWSDDNIFVAIAIESREGIQNLEEIIQVPGIDALFLGTFDLAQEMGYFGDNNAAAVREAIDELIACASKANMPLFATLYRGQTDEEVRAELEQWRSLGARIVNVVSDRRLISTGLQERRMMIPNAATRARTPFRV